jgi:hypothetical protein
MDNTYSERGYPVNVEILGAFTFHVQLSWCWGFKTVRWGLIVWNVVFQDAGNSSGAWALALVSSHLYNDG